jgi:integrase
MKSADFREFNDRPQLRRLNRSGSEPDTRQLVHHKGAVSRRVLSPKLDGRWEGWYGFRRGFGSKLFRLGVQPRSSMMILRHTDVSTTEAYYIIVGRTETPVAMEKLKTALGKKWAKRESQYSSKLQK